MLEKIDLTQKLDKVQYKELIPDLELKLSELQRAARELKIPIILVFEGWDAAGKGTLINELITPLDPRGFKVYSTDAPNSEEKHRPFLWRFWMNLLEKGKITVFDRSWYRRILEHRVDEGMKQKQYEDAVKHINDFERQLIESGYIIIKFFLHISKREQKKRFEKLLNDKTTAWRVTGEDKRHHKHYEDYLEAYEDMLAGTGLKHAPWHVIEAQDKRYATVKIYNTVIEAIDKKIHQLKDNKVNKIKAAVKDKKANAHIPAILDQIDLSKTLTQEEYDEKLEKYQKRLRELEFELYSERVPLLILYEGWDAAGKGGNIKRLTQELDPRGYGVVPISAPNDIEKAHHYLWRFWNSIPKAGHITIFDRTWYGRVLVERVEGFCNENEWKRAYKEINEMEEQMADFGAVIVKFWLQISKDEQLKRFEERQNTPYKQWKITEEDWRNREKWDLYKEAVDEMIYRTNTEVAPWTIVESNSKYYARIKALKTVIDSVEKKLKNM